MKWTSVLVLTFIVFIITVYEWPKINRNQKKEKKAFIVLITIGWVLAVTLMFYPDLKGPTDVVNQIYKPFGEWLEK